MWAMMAVIIMLMLPTMADDVNNDGTVDVNVDDTGDRHDDVTRGCIHRRPANVLRCTHAISSFGPMGFERQV